MEGGRTALVHQQRIGTLVDEGTDRARAPTPYGSMKRGYTALVDSVGVRTGIDEICDHLTLLTRIPVTRTRASICSVVQRFGSPSVTGATEAPRATSHSASPR